jgi:hypothetical protein
MKFFHRTYFNDPKERGGTMGRKISCVCILFWMLVVFAVVPVCSEETSAPERSHKWLREIGLLTGFGTASINNQSDYQVIPFLPQIGFDINPAAECLHIRPRGTIEFVTEPLINVVISPNANAEVGCSFLLKYSDKLTSHIAPYLEGGVGAIYTTQHTEEQGTQYNFIPQVGAGLQFFLNESFALTGGYRFRHLSNASISDDNSGINHHFALCGISYFFQ